MAVEIESVKHRLQSSLLELSSLTRQLLESVTRDGKATADQSALSLTTFLDNLVERDQEIRQLAVTAVEMRNRQEEIDHVTNEIEGRGRELLALQTKLQETEKVLEEAVYRGRQKLESIAQAKKGAVYPEDLICYAHRISQASSTVSPVGWQPSDPRRPFPQDIEMRSGLLGRLTAGQVGVAGSKVNGDESKLRSFNHNNTSKQSERLPGATGKGFTTSDNIYEEPEVMTEDTSESSSDEG